MMTHDAPAPRRLRAAALYAAAWTVVALFYASQWLIYNLYDATPESPFRLVGVALTDWYVRAIVAAPVFFLARRFPVRRATWISATLVHVPAAFAFSFTKIGICWWLGFVLPWLSPVPFWRLVLGEIHLDLATYGIVLGLVHWRESRLRLREHEREAARHALLSSRLETRLARAELDALKMQIQPHFLFNTLHSISALVQEDGEAAELMISRLSDFLRLVIEHAGAQEVPLAEELDFLRRYLDIQQVRFQDRLRVEIEVAPDALDALVPNLVLQPLVENAIRHAVEPRTGGGRVTVRAARDAAGLRLTVRDDGPGLRGSAKAGAGVGLANTRARLEHLYGAAQGLAIADHAGGGVEVVVTLPYRRRPAA